MTKNLNNVVSTLALVAAAAALIWAHVIQPQLAAQVPAGMAPRFADTNVTITLPPRYRLFGTGKVAVVEFTDFECPFCRGFATDTLPQLREQFAKMVTYYTVNFPLPKHPNAPLAAAAATCAAAENEQALDAMHEKLFSKPLTGVNVADYAVAIGIPRNRFVDCLTADSTTELVNRDKRMSERLEVQGTPTFFLGVIDAYQLRLTRRFTGGPRLETLTAEINALVQGQ